MLVTDSFYFFLVISHIISFCFGGNTHRHVQVLFLSLSLGVLRVPNVMPTFEPGVGQMQDKCLPLRTVFLAQVFFFIMKILFGK